MLKYLVVATDIKKRLLGSEKFRFAGVGAINTSVDFIVLFLLTQVFAVPVLAANMVSTSAALTTSYFLNKKAVFKSSGKSNVVQAAQFLVVTLSGLWVIQGTVVWFSLVTLEDTFGIEPALALFMAKLFAMLFSLVWNYLWYSRVIFREDRNETTR